MPKLGLALSGGGFRATLYHLGVLRYLKDAGLLHQVTDIASVSGGSILAAHLVSNWDRYTGDDARFDEAVLEVIRFVQFDLRNHIVRRMPLQYPVRFLAKFTRADREKHGPNALLERYYRQFLYGERRLYELTEHPMLHILATNVSNGGLTVFNRQGLFMQQRDDARSANFRHVPGEMASLARVVCASSAFPGFFPPVKISAADLGVREGQFATEWFTDGGVYDNLGIRAFSWLKQLGHEFDQVMVSDAGKPFQILTDGSLGFVGQSVRATDILWDRVWQLERQNFGDRPGFLFLPITSRVEVTDDFLPLPPVVQAEVQSVRTDLDAFSDVEIDTLAQHGYGVARKICRENDFGVTSGTPDQPWSPYGDPPARVKTQADSSPREASAATAMALSLRGSSRRKIWTRLLNWLDWPSYLYVVLGLILLVFVPFKIYQLHRESRVQAEVIAAISSGDPDIKQLLALLNENPTKEWQADVVVDKDEATEIETIGIDLMTYSRIIDLRRWDTQAENEEDSFIYVRDRITVKLNESYEGDGKITIPFPISIDEIEYRQPRSQVKAEISRVAGIHREYGQNKTLYEFTYDLSQAPHGEAVNLELEGRMKTRMQIPRAPFYTRMKTDLVTVWMLFPTDRPYQNYTLLRYPADHSEAPEVMNSRYSINHPYGSLIGWSVVNAQAGMVYECRWTTADED